MSVYSIKGKGWRYDFVLAGQRYTEAWFTTKRKAQAAEADKRKEIAVPVQEETPTSTDMAFLELVNRRLDHVKAYNSEKHYTDYCYMARRWIERWSDQMSSQVSQGMVEKFVLERSRRSPDTANKEIRYLRATFNFGKKKRWINVDPTDGMEFLPVVKRVRYVPPVEDIEKVIAVADQGTRDYLLTIRDTMGRMSEINRLTWSDVDLTRMSLILYTRKKKGGDLTPRVVPMTDRLHQILKRRYSQRDPTRPWVFWHIYTSSKTGEKCQGPYKERKKIMRTLCRKAGVRYFRFHGLRHSGASVMDQSNVPIGTIQRILGHENRQTTEIYLHSVGEAERVAMRAFEQATTGSFSHTESHTRPG